VTTIDLSPRCPNCANEMESEEAIVCLHCGYNTMSRAQSRTRAIRDVTGGDQFLWLLPGILCAVGVALLIAIDVTYCLMIEQWINVEEWYGIVAHMGVKLWLVIISLFIMYYLGRFAIKRLLINNTPPEIEERRTK
jgi:hypothetical protein